MLPDINSCVSSILHFFIHASRYKFKLFLHSASASNILYKVLVRDAHRKGIIDIFKELKIFFHICFIRLQEKAQAEAVAAVAPSVASAASEGEDPQLETTNSVLQTPGGIPPPDHTPLHSPPQAGDHNF